jgi:hypothetical protein
MERLHLAHLVVICAWGGLVMGEVLLELSARDSSAQAHAARVHFWIDLVIELPLLISVLVTGTILTVRAWPLTPLHLVKLAFASAAIAFNLACVVLVVIRHRLRADERVVARYSRLVRLAGLGIPFAAAAGVIGIGYFRG